MRWRWKQRVLERRSRRPVSRFSSATLPAGGPRRSWHASTFDPLRRGERTGGMRFLVSRRWSKRHARYLARSKLGRTGAAACLLSGWTHKVVGLSVTAVLLRSASTARPSEGLSRERCVDVARWPRPVSTLRSERVSSFALNSGTVGRIQLRPARSTAAVPRHKRMCVCVSATEATVRRRRRRQASPSRPPSLDQATCMAVMRRAAPRSLAGLFLSSSAPKSAREYRSHGGFRRTSLPPPACAPIYNLLSSVLRNSNMGCQSFCGVNEFTGKSEICARFTCSMQCIRSQLCVQVGHTQCSHYVANCQIKHPEL